MGGKQVFDMYEMWSDKDRFESKITPRFLAEATGLKEVFEGIGLSILTSCVKRLMSRNSVLDELRGRKLEAIQDEISEKVFCRSWMFCGKFPGEKAMKSYDRFVWKVWQIDLCEKNSSIHKYIYLGPIATAPFGSE
jgi:hypothetical protein